MSTAPALNLPRLGDPINDVDSYVKRGGAVIQAAHWNAVLADDDVFGPGCGLLVGVSPVRDHAGRYPLVWAAAADL